MGKKLNTRITGNIWEQTEVKSERKIINYRSFRFHTLYTLVIGLSFESFI